MNLLRRAQIFNHLLQPRSRDHVRGQISLLASHSPTRHFLTVGGGEAEPPTQDNFDSSSPIDGFLRPHTKGNLYAKMLGLHRSTLKTDIITVLEGCNLTPDDVKFVYNKFFSPVAAMVQFPSPTAYDTGVKAVIKQGRLYKIEKVDRSEWDFTKLYNGKYVLLQGVPMNTTMEDVDRFLSGFDFDASSIEFIAG
ncbi:hypothetical protein Dimus_007254 [Dionaea muscipula]